jgi:PiT family inorganic phosphate transporter
MDVLLAILSHPLIAAIVLLALLFDFLNGMHDAANSIATVVSTRVLSPRFAVLWAAFFNFIAYFIVGTAVAKTMGKGIVHPELISNSVIASALIGASFWNWLTIRLGLPVSSSHSLIGGLLGAGIARAGTDVVMWAGLKKVAIFIVLSPTIGLILGFMMMVITLWVARHQTPRRVDGVFRVLQLFSSAAYSVGHGANDAQKTAGIITTLLVINGFMAKDHPIPAAVVLLCYTVIAAGTMAGGWKIVKTLGMKMTHIQPVGGFCAETAAAITLYSVSHFGIPVSTTHTITGAIMGVGATRRLSAVRWGVARNIVFAWILTIPFAAAVAAICEVIITQIARLIGY